MYQRFSLAAASVALLASSAMAQDAKTVIAAAQKALGDVVFVELPAVGKKVKAGDETAVVESVKAASDVYAPVSGEVIEDTDASGTVNGGEAAMTLATPTVTLYRDQNGDGVRTAAELMLVLSAPLRKTACRSSTVARPPPAHRGMKSSRAHCSRRSKKRPRPSCEAVMS